MEYNQWEVTNALSELADKYPDSQANNNKAIGSSNNRIVIKNESYVKLSMKRSNISNVEYTNCHFQNVALTGSFFRSVIFCDVTLIGNSFTSCDFYATEFSDSNSGSYEANNFSQSNFTSCLFNKTQFVSGSMIQTLFHKCRIENSIFKSSTLEGCQFINCIIRDTDLGNVNVEFIDIHNSSIERVVFPFYQFAYVIGAAEYINEPFSSISLRAADKEIPVNEYKNQLRNLIIYFWNRGEYFPVCNLCIALGNDREAKTSMLDGINAALNDLDFRMIRHFCRLGKRHYLLDEVTNRRIINTIEDFLSEKNIPSERLNTCLIHFGEIREILTSANPNSISFNMNIRTNVQKSDTEGVAYVNSLCNEINSKLSKEKHDQTGFQVSISNYSPYEIVLHVVSVASQVATIATLIWSIIDSHCLKKDHEHSKTDFEEIDKSLHQKYIDNRIQLLKEQLLNLRYRCTKANMNHYIEEITQQLQTDIEELYDSNIMIFKKQKKSD